MNILITGSSGYIGKNLITHKYFKNKNIFFLMRKSSTPNTSTQFIYDDEVEILTKKILDLKIDGIIHLASLYIKQHKPNEISSLVESNIAFPARLIEAASLSDVKWFINTGTLWQNFNNADFNPVNLYASTKEAFQNILEFYSQTSKIKIVTLKLGDTFGPHDSRPKILNLLIESFKNDKTLGMSPGEQTLNLLYIDDVVDGFCHLAEILSNNPNSLNSKEYCLQAKDTFTLKTLVKNVESILNIKFKINWGASEYRAREVMYPPTNISILSGWEPKFSLEQAIKNSFKSEV